MSDIPANTSTPKLIYILFLANIVIPILGIVGIVMAYINKNDAPQWLQTHYQFQIRTFWIGFLYFFIGSVLTTIIVGYLLLLFAVIWLIIRCVKGMKYLDAGQPYPEPTSWMF
ncbi:MAG TPA: hypothetical protein ENI24_02805 [Methylophaga sp.]|nr:hypothetical protein [Methylophaga sp.]